MVASSRKSSLMGCVLYSLALFLPIRMSFAWMVRESGNLDQQAVTNAEHA